MQSKVIETDAKTALPGRTLSQDAIHTHTYTQTAKETVSLKLSPYLFIFSLPGEEK